MTKKDVFQEDKFGVRFFIYNRKKYFVVNDLRGCANQESLPAIQRFLKRNALLRIFGTNKNDAKVPKFCLSFARYKIVNKREIKEAIKANTTMTLSNVSADWLEYHKISVSVKTRRQKLKVRGTAEELYRKVLKRRINHAANSVV